MICGLAWRMLTGVDPRCLWKFLYGFGFKGYRAVERFKRAAASSHPTAPFLMISLTDRCNLRCAGCWVSCKGTGRELAVEDVDRLICEWKARGAHFFGLLGGEPLLYPHLFDLLSKHPDCYFQLFTNGTLLDETVAEKMRKLANLTPLISIEGLEEESDRRRGGSGIYRSAIDALRNCHAQGLVTGIASSVCATNFEEVVNEYFVRKAIDLGAMYLWYYIYRPVGPEPCSERALSAEQIRKLRQFLVEIRAQVPLVVVDAYWDHEGKPLCPAAVGISHHIGPGGDVEPCPPLQFSTGKITDGFDGITQSEELENARKFLRDNSHGCILLDDPAKLAQYMQQNSLKDSSGRDTFIDELQQMSPQADHDMAENAIPEKHWLYRFAKKHWFFGFGAYG